MSAKTVVLLLAVVCLGGCGKAETSSTSSGGSEVLGEGDALAKLQSVTNDYVREVVEEAKDVRVIYTDGVFDDDIRREAKRRGIELEPISMMAVKGPLSLRMVVREKGDDVALQLGFELWKHQGWELPFCSGVLARTGKMPEEDRQRGIEAARRLGERILELQREDLVDAMPNKELKEKVLHIQWRIARIARIRAEREDREGQTELALKDVLFADRLDEYNDGIKKITQEWDKVREQTSRVITPREALQLALVRCDFALASRYAELFLKDDPDDPYANYAKGMNFYQLNQWVRAEECLRRCLIRKPQQPAVWNNLALICMHTERYEEALKLAHRALELRPESDEVKDTIKQIEAARDKTKKEKTEKARKR